ncbi:MAG TPA: hypothetical protein VK489_07840 [Ferruginibacter sp.]|nr:hypothetical protein [Ferruginibacter sp.]
MKSFITATLLIFFCISTLAQESNFDKGYKDGYKEGYCYQEYGCIPPIPPIPPIPTINESSKSYKDGYNRGFLAGQSKKEEDERKKKQGYTPNTSSTGRQWQSTEYQPMVDDNFIKMYMQALQIRQQQQRQQYAQLLEAERRQKEADLQRAINQTAQTLNLFSSLKSKATKVADGWHTVVSLDRIDFCENRLVRVENNKIVEYYTDAYKWDNKDSERKILAGGGIDTAKTVIKIIPFDESNESEASYVEVYFIDYLMNTSSRAQSPIKTGKVSFWTSVKNGGTTYIRFGQSTGQMTKFFKEGTPICDQDGTLTFEAIPGTFSYSAKDDKRTWNGNITISSGRCSTFQLSK